MTEVRIVAQWTEAKVLEGLIAVVRETGQDFASEFADSISRDTHLGTDLGFESIDIVELSVAIEEHFQRRKLPFQEMFTDKEHYYDLTVGEIADFLFRVLNAPAS